MTADSPRIIDWACALRASAVFDIARVHVSLSELAPEDADPEPPRLQSRGLVRGWYGELDFAVADLERAMRLSPRDPLHYNAMLGLALLGRLIRPE